MGLLLALLLLAAPRPLSDSVVIASDGPIRCDGRPLVKYWVFPRAVTIQRVELFPLTDGAPPGQPFPQVDYHTTVRVSRPPGRVIAVQPMDHYVPFAGNVKEDKAFAEWEAPRLRKGDHVSVEHACQELFGLQSHSQFIVVITFIEDP